MLDHLASEGASHVIGQESQNPDDARGFKHKQNIKGSSQLLRLLQAYHYRHAPDAYKDRFLPAVTTDVFKAEFLRVRDERKARGVPRELPSRAIDLSMQVAWEILDTDKAITEGRDSAINGTVRRIQGIVCRHYGVTFTDLISERRQAHIVRPRMVAMYLAKKYTTRSLPQIGRKFGGRDHTTVLHSVNKIPKLMETDAELRAIVGILCEKIEATIHSLSTPVESAGSYRESTCDTSRPVIGVSA